MNKSARPSARPGKVTLARVVNLGSRLTERRGEPTPRAGENIYEPGLP
jgi:hypothetical protein